MIAYFKEIFFAFRPLSLILLSAFLLACTTPPPSDVSNVCKIFEQYPSWYEHAKKAEKRWGIPVYVQMAIMHQESRFVSKAKPPRTKLLGFIPWTRPSSAYGYSQALDGTWKEYQKATGKSSTRRHSFEDATDFVAWYGNRAVRRLGIRPTNAYALYLAYHEGLGGYERRTYRNKSWLINVAGKVQRQSDNYRAQLNRCAKKLQKPWWKLW